MRTAAAYGEPPAPATPPARTAPRDGATECPGLHENWGPERAGGWLGGRALSRSGLQVLREPHPVLLSRRITVAPQPQPLSQEPRRGRCCPPAPERPERGSLTIVRLRDRAPGRGQGPLLPAHEEQVRTPSQTPWHLGALPAPVPSASMGRRRDTLVPGLSGRRAGRSLGTGPCSPRPARTLLHRPPGLAGPLSWPPDTLRAPLRFPTLSAGPRAPLGRSGPSWPSASLASAAAAPPPTRSVQLRAGPRGQRGGSLGPG